jgi:hypothetical protein
MSSRLIEVPLGLELVFPGGSVRHDYSKLPAPRVVRSLARAHLSLTNSGGGIKTPGTSHLYARAIRRIARFFERGLGADALGVLDAAGYRRLIADLGGEHLESCVRALLLRLVETDPDVVHPSVRPLLLAPHLLTPPPYVPIAPLSGAEAKRLEAACRQSILAFEARLAEGERLLEPVSEPERLTEAERIERQIIEVVARGAHPQRAQAASGGPTRSPRRAADRAAVPVAAGSGAVPVVVGAAHGAESREPGRADGRRVRGSRERSRSPALVQGPRRRS